MAQNVAVTAGMLALVLATSVPSPARAQSACSGAKSKAAGKTASSTLGCQANAVGKGGTVDPGCTGKATTKMTSAFMKADARGDCLTTADATKVQAKIDSLSAAAATAVGNGGTASKCDAAKLKAMGKKAAAKASCHAKALVSGLPPDSGCLTAASAKFAAAVGKAETRPDCAHTGQVATLEALVDQFISTLVVVLEIGPSASFTTTAGTTSCGSAGLTTPPSPPVSGEIDSNTSGTTKISDLGAGCLYLGGGDAVVAPGIRVPDGATSLFGISGTSLSASDGTGPTNCTKGSGPARHCVNGNAGLGGGTCGTDADCGGAVGSCALDANCFFGTPLPVLTPPPLGATTSCVLNAIDTDASGTLDTTTGAATLTVPLAARVYITGNTASPCPKCVAGGCTYGENAGGSCSTTSSAGTSLDCPPRLAGFQATLPIALNPLTTGAVSVTSASGNFCPGQNNPGAFGQMSTQRIAEAGTPAGDVTDGASHAAILAATACVPTTGNAALDAIIDLPGPAALGQTMDVQLN